ncbi:hypothetical protein FOZ62_026547 [Perkinsus olseni]|uniref:Uncharacterized protein n=1 Tax=Perkinsus olseni TaxID=32597 RepID=A0A7J6QN04_PEROL|nr:hypothetical protein FOZ62_026547 [Perkinsus olseni]
MPSTSPGMRSEPLHRRRRSAGSEGRRFVINRKVFFTPTLSGSISEMPKLVHQLLDDRPKLGTDTGRRSSSAESASSGGLRSQVHVGAGSSAASEVEPPFLLIPDLTNAPGGAESTNISSRALPAIPEPVPEDVLKPIGEIDERREKLMQWERADNGILRTAIRESISSIPGAQAAAKPLGAGSGLYSVVAHYASPSGVHQLF